MSNALWFALGCAVFAIAYGAYSITWILRQPSGNERMREIAAAIQTGAMAYLNRQYRTIAIVGIVILIVLGATLGWRVAVGYLIGVGAWSDRTADALEPLVRTPPQLVAAAVNTPEYLTS